MTGQSPQIPIPNSQLLVLDVDGVLTDGGLYVDDKGVPSKKFNVKDGLGIKLAQRFGIQVAILTGKTSRIVDYRAKELGIEHLIQGSKDKGADLRSLCERTGIAPSDTAMMGDDLPDLPAFAVVGYRIAVGDAVEEVQQAADFVTAKPGGRGAVREAIEHLLKSQNKWDAALAVFTHP
jgi:3-deoxy-D-manno-octulosonate 8-phosphate phosphatase (KDO 8-P phosphatase)